MSLRIIPMTIGRAKEFVAAHHRHNKPPVGGLFAVGASKGGQVVAVAIIGRPIARMLDDGDTCEVTRLCTDGTRNACSLLYGAACRAAKALGWKRIVTYTLASEPGTSLKASGWVYSGAVQYAPWDRPSRPRSDSGLPKEDKMRWVKSLNASEGIS